MYVPADAYRCSILLATIPLLLLCFSMAGLAQVPISHHGQSMGSGTAVANSHLSGWSPTPQPSPAPDLDLSLNGSAHATLLLPDNSLIVAGDFTRVNGIERRSIVRLLPAGQVDMSWNPDIDGVVYALALDDDGRIYAGGSFSEVGNQDRNNLVRLLGTGEADATWVPEPNSSVYALAVSSGNDPAIYAGGHFTEIGGQARLRLARLNSSTGQAVSGWDVPASASVHALAFGVADSLYVGGRFTSIGGQARNYVARVNPATAQVASWNPGLEADGMGPATPPGVYALAARSDSHMIVAGAFYKAGGLNRQGVALVAQNAAGSVDPDWAPNPNAGGVDADIQINAVAVSHAGTVYLGGSFTHIGYGAAMLPRGNLARILPGSQHGNADPNWDPDVARGRVYTTLVVPGSEILFAGGNFLYIGNEPRAGLAALRSDGVPMDRLAQLGGLPGLVLTLARQADGGTIVGGVFSMVEDGTVRENILRLRPDGSLDPVWQPRFNNYVTALELGPDGSIFVGGVFSRLNNLDRIRLAKLSATGVPDPDWAPRVTHPNGAHVEALALAPTGALYVGGRFSSIGETGTTPLTRGNLARISSQGTGMVDVHWNPAVTATSEAAIVNSLALSADGLAIFVGGRFDSVAGNARQNIAKVKRNGLLDDEWNIPANERVEALQLGDDGWLYVAGAFTQIGGRGRRGIARLSPINDGMADEQWHPDPNGTVYDFSLDEHGMVYLAGDFTGLESWPRAGLARILPVGSVDAGWDPQPVGTVWAVQASAGGSVVVGGYFSEIGGVARTAVARLPGEDRIFASDFEY